MGLWVYGFIGLMGYQAYEGYQAYRIERLDNCPGHQTGLFIETGFEAACFNCPGIYAGVEDVIGFGL